MWSIEFVKKHFFSQAIVVDRFVYVSGCLGLDKDSLKIVPGGSGPEMAQTLENMKAILEAAGSCIENVVKVTIFVDDLGDFGIINEEYKKGLIYLYPIGGIGDFGHWEYENFQSYCCFEKKNCATVQ